MKQIQFVSTTEWLTFTLLWCTTIKLAIRLAVCGYLDASEPTSTLGWCTEHLLACRQVNEHDWHGQYFNQVLMLWLVTMGRLSLAAHHLFSNCILPLCRNFTISTVAWHHISMASDLVDTYIWPCLMGQPDATSISSHHYAVED